MVGSLLLKKFGVESPTREKPKSGVLEKNIDFWGNYRILTKSGPPIVPIGTIGPLRDNAQGMP